MSQIHRNLVLLALFILSGCTTSPPPRISLVPEVPEAVAKPTGWRAIVSEADQRKIERANAAWAQGLAEAHAAGFTRAMAKEGALLEPEAAQPLVAATPGAYHCRTLKLGYRPRAASTTTRRRARRRAARRPHSSAFIAYPAQSCYLTTEGDRLAFTKASGSEKPGGWLWIDTSDQMVFVGGAPDALSDDVPAYGVSRASNVVGVLERVSDFRWRMVLPWPAADTTLTIIELSPDPTALPVIAPR